MTLEHPNIVFAGTPDFAVPTLQRLADSGHRPVAVYTQPDRPSGRGRKLRAGPVKALALELGLEVRQPTSLRGTEAVENLQSLQPDLMVVIAYGLILPQEILDVPRHGCWNIHASLLPRWRGAAPIQRAIEAGDSETGVCIMQMEAGLDTGPVFHRLSTAIGADDTGGSMHDRLAVLGADALLDCLAQLTRGQLLPPTPQIAQAASYATKLSKAEARLNWGDAATCLERKIRAFNPWPVCWTTVAGKRLRIWAATASDQPTRVAAGTVIARHPDALEVACGLGSLRVTELQPEGARAMTASEYLNAADLKAGQMLGQQ